MYSADRWYNVDSTTFKYITANSAKLVLEVNASRKVGKLTFDGWFITKDTLDELIEVLQQVKLYMP